MTGDISREFLQSIGYQVRFRHHEWVECLIAGDGATYSGRGLDREAAFRAALAQLCPTPLALRLLEDAIRRAQDERQRAAASSTPAPAAEETFDPEDEPLPEVRTEGAIEERTPGQIAVILSRPSMPRMAVQPGPGPAATTSAAAATAVITPLPSPASLPPPAMPSLPSLQPDYPALPDPRVIGDPDKSLEALDILMDRIRDSREELGLCSPDRQRLAMLAWICEARSHTDAFPDDLRIRDRVGAISRQLTEIGKTYWPGSVTALQLHMQPRDLPRHLLGGTATTWHRAAELAEQSLRMKELEDERRGYDTYGWADAKQLSPRPQDPRRLLEQMAGEVERLSGTLSTHAAPADQAVRPDGAQFTRWVRQLRWLRTTEVDPEQWARIAGRLRWWSFRREPALASASRELEAGFAPSQSWASLLGHDPEHRRQVLRMIEVLGQGPRLDGGDTKSDLLTWLLRALPFGDTHHGNIVKLMEHHRETVLGLNPEELPEADRRLRRRLVRLQEDLQHPNGPIKTAPLPEPPSSEDSLMAAAGDGPAPLPDDLLRKVRGSTEGKRSVFVSNRRDPDLQASLQEAFGFASLDCKIAEPRRVQALGEAIEEGQYDLVLAATGFQLQSLDHLLAKACRTAGVTYVRVNRGRPLACLRALARIAS